MILVEEQICSASASRVGFWHILPLRLRPDEVARLIIIAISLRAIASRVIHRLTIHPLAVAFYALRCCIFAVIIAPRGMSTAWQLFRYRYALMTYGKRCVTGEDQAWRKAYLLEAEMSKGFTRAWCVVSDSARIERWCHSLVWIRAQRSTQRPWYRFAKQARKG